MHNIYVITYSFLYKYHMFFSLHFIILFDVGNYNDLYINAIYQLFTMGL